MRTTTQGGGEPPGEWVGKGADALSLTGKVEGDTLKSLFEGFTPDGTPLVQNAGHENRHSARDLTFSAPKSASVLWSQASPEVRQIEVPVKGNKEKQIGLPDLNDQLSKYRERA